MTRLSFVIGSAAWIASAWAGGRAAAAAEPRLEKTTLFTAGEAGYKLYRIPGLVVTARGTVLAYCEARRSDRGDWGTIDILLRRSTDGGRHWLPPQHVAHHGPPVPKNPVALEKKLGGESDRTVNNPVAIADRDGTVHFLYCVEYARCFVMHSADDGETWSEPLDITATFERFRPEYNWRVLATGPGHGIPLHGGRLLVPVWLSTGTGGHGHRPSIAATVYSDDHGRTWRRGEIAVPDTPEIICPNETAAVELVDGRVMLNARSESKANRRLITTSPDGASGWSKPVFHDELLEPICEASMARLSLSPPSDRNRLLFSNPDTLDPLPGQRAVPGKNRVRKNVSVKLSYDEGRTWPVVKRLEDGLSGYSDLAVGPDGTIYCLYECTSTDGDIDRSGRLTLARFDLHWLTDGRDSLPATKSWRAMTTRVPPRSVASGAASRCHSGASACRIPNPISAGLSCVPVPEILRATPTAARPGLRAERHRANPLTLPLPLAATEWMSECILFRSIPKSPRTPLTSVLSPTYSMPQVLLSS